jgi:hypothetical protein
MMSVVGPSASNPTTKRGILCTRTFLATHPPVFADATDPLEADSWLQTIESKFRLLCCTEYQKTPYTAQQLRGTAGVWWASYIATLPNDHHVSWE